MVEDRQILKRWRWILLFVGVWTTLALLEAATVYVELKHMEKAASWALALRRSFKETYSFALLSAGVLWFCGRFPLESVRRARWIATHTGVAVAVALAHVVMVSWLEAGEMSVQHPDTVLTFSYLFHQLAITYVCWDGFKYWILVLGHLGWQFYRRYRERERQAAALAAELVQARLQALRMQINPHFLFNTLHTISSLIHSQPETADRMIARLSELLRATLDAGETQEVPLREEIDFLKRYLEIEQMRFADRLTVAFDIEAKANELLVPHLILQPLVENALRHGIERREEAGRLEISAAICNGDTLELKVRNNGNDLPDENGEPLREGIGLKNVRSRLTHLYGAAQSFELRKSPGGGVDACLRIPCCSMPRSQAPRVVVMSATEAGLTDVSLPAATSAKSCDC